MYRLKRNFLYLFKLFLRFFILVSGKINSCNRVNFEYYMEAYPTLHLLNLELGQPMSSGRPARPAITIR